MSGATNGIVLAEVAWAGIDDRTADVSGVALRCQASRGGRDSIVYVTEAGNGGRPAELVGAVNGGQPAEVAEAGEDRRPTKVIMMAGQLWCQGLGYGGRPGEVVVSFCIA